jgi:hypothetical protein
MKNFFSAATLIFALFFGIATTGCAGRMAARDSARRLAASVQLYEDHLDGFIKKETTWSQSRQKEQQASRRLTAEGQLGTFRIAAASAAAEKLIDDPAKESRPSNLTAYLKETFQQQADLNAKLLADQQQEVKDLQARLSALQSKKEAVQKIRLNLTKLAAKTSLKDEVLDLKSYAEAVKADFDALEKKTSGSDAQKGTAN